MTKHDKIQDGHESRERSGNYRIVKICLHEIEAMKELGFSRKTILERLESYFGNTLTPDQLSSNINRIRKEIDEKEKKMPEKAQTRKDRVAEIVKNPELIHGNLHIYQQIINPKMSGPGNMPAARKANSGTTRKTIETSRPASLSAKDEALAVEKVWTGILTYVTRTNTKYREEDVPQIKEILAQKINQIHGKVPLEVIEEHLRSFFN